MQDWLTPTEISDVFSTQMQQIGGKVSDAMIDCPRLFARGILPEKVEVAPGDFQHGGVALCASDTDIFVHPYLFRLVCSNGAIMAQAMQTHRIRRHELSGELQPILAQAVEACCSPAAFTFSTNQMRAARDRMISMTIMMGHLMATHRGSQWRPIFAQILRRYTESEHRSAYDLVNAITSVARDTSDPQTKWDLEQMGGSVPSFLRDPVTSPSRGRALMRDLAQV